MAYQLTLEDLPQKQKKPSQPEENEGYQLTLEDLPKKGLNSQQLGSMIGIGSTPFGNIQDLIYGFGKSGAGIAKTFLGNKAPDMPDIRQSNQNPFAEAAGQYLPFAMMGGPTLLGSTLGAGAFGATQYEPEHPGFIDTALNKVGVPMEGGRTRNAIEDAVLNMVFHGLAKPFTKIGQQEMPGAPPIDFRNKVNFAPGESEFTNVPFQPPSFLAGQEQTPLTANIGNEFAVPSANFMNKSTFSPRESQFNNLQFQPPAFLNKTSAEPLSANIANEISTNIMGNRNLEQSGKELASDITNTYKNIKEQHTKEFDKVFDSPTGEISYQTDEPILVKDKLMQNSAYRRQNLLEDIKDKNLHLLNNRFMENPNIQNAHHLQSELGSEIGYLKRQRENNLLDADGKNRLQNYVNAQNIIQQDIRSQLNEINPNLMVDYDIAREDWRKNVIPYHSDKQLREIAEGRIKNPVAGDVISIFKNPEENINKINADLPKEAKDRIIHIALGKNKEDLKPEDLLNARKSLDLSGMSTYIDPYHEQGFRNLRNNLQTEKAKQTQVDANESFVQGLKQLHSQLEQERRTAAGKREVGHKVAISESEKIMKDYQSHLNVAAEDNVKAMLKRQQEQADANRALVQRLKQVQYTAEQERISGGKARAQSHVKAVNESNKIAEEYRNQFNKQHQQDLKEIFERQKVKNAFYKKLLIGTAGVAGLSAIKKLGFDNADLLAAYLGYKSGKYKPGLKK